MLERYEQVVPGFANRLLLMAESETHHRHTMEKVELNADILERRTGQWLAFLIGLTALVLGSYTAIQGSEIAGSFLGTGGVVGLVYVFLRRNQ